MIFWTRAQYNPTAGRKWQPRLPPVVTSPSATRCGGQLADSVCGVTQVHRKALARPGSASTSAAVFMFLTFTAFSAVKVGFSLPFGPQQARPNNRAMKASGVSGREEGLRVFAAGPCGTTV